MKSIVERLRFAAKHGGSAQLCDEAADKIEELEENYKLTALAAKSLLEEINRGTYWPSRK